MANVKLLGKQTGNVLEDVFRNRGLTKQRANELLNLDKFVQLPYSALHNIEKAVNDLLNTLEDEDSVIGIIVDTDMDGYTSSAILYRYIKRLYPFAKIHIIHHSEKKHGLSSDIKLPNDLTYLIIPDASIEREESILWCKKKGIKVLSIDHHNILLDYDKYDNYICVNPLYSPDYYNKHISGVGVTYRVLQAMDDKLGVQYADDYLDLVSLGNVSDAMNSDVDDTRYLMNQCNNRDKVKNTWLKRTIETKFQESEKLTLFKLAFNIPPLVNAVARMGSLKEREIVFNGLISDYSADIEASIKTATQVKGKQDRLKKKTAQKTEEVINLSDPILIADISSEDNEGLNGLIANQISSKYNKPTIVFGGNGDFIVGSARNCNEDLCPSFRDWLLKTGLVEFAQGHDNAFGVKIKNTNLQAIVDAFKEYVGDREITNEQTYLVDGIFDVDTINKQDIIDVGKYEALWATNLKEPLFLIKDIKVPVESIERLGARGSVMKIFYNNISFIKTFLSKALYSKATCEDKPCFGDKYISLDIVGKFKINDYEGVEYPQVEIVDLDSKVISKKEYEDSVIIEQEKEEPLW